MRVLKVHYYPDTDGCSKKLVIYAESSLALRTANTVAANLSNWFPGVALPQRVMILEKLFERQPKLIEAALDANRNVSLAKSRLANVNRYKQESKDAEKAFRRAERKWLESEKKFEASSAPIDKFSAMLDKIAEQETR